MMILMGIMSAVAILAVMVRTGKFHWFTRFPALTDIAVSVLLAVLFAGTLGGMVAAMAGGLFFSLVLTGIVWLKGYQWPAMRLSAYA